MSSIIDNIRRDLISASDEKTRISGEGFFKEPVKLYGVKSHEVHLIGKKNFSNLENTKKQVIFDLCRELWQSGYMEESIIACEWS